MNPEPGQVPFQRKRARTPLKLRGIRFFFASFAAVLSGLCGPMLFSVLGT
jgi:hypothetical protein